MDMRNERHYLARVSLYYKMTKLTSIFPILFTLFHYITPLF